MNARIPLLLAPLLILACSGCQQDTVSSADIVYLDVEDAFSVEKSGTILGLGSRTAVWIDPRREDAFQAGHIPGAMNLQISEVDDNLVRLEDFDVCVVYGDNYSSALAEAMSKVLLRKGLGDVRTLRGGLNAWTTQGNALETGDGETADQGG